MKWLRISIVLKAVTLTLACIPALTTTSAAATPKSPYGPSAPAEASAPFSWDKARELQKEWAAFLRVPAELTNSIGMKFVLIPPGDFEMGLSEAEIQRELSDARKEVPPIGGIFPSRVVVEGPRHHVKITKAFYIAAYEVTQSEYQKIMGVNPSAFSPRSAKQMIAKRMKGIDTNRHPVESVTWDEAKQFVRVLSGLPGESGSHRSYRLPTEAEWEYTCRAGTTTRWHCGDDKSTLSDFAWFNENVNQGMTHPVGTKKGNAWGLFDMHGNVFEWCSDRHTASSYDASGLVVDPQGPAEGVYHIVRGGCWERYAEGCRSTYRGIAGAAPWPVKGWIIGFRIVCEINVTPSLSDEKK